VGGWLVSVFDGGVERETPKNPIFAIAKKAAAPLPTGLSNTAYAGTLVGANGLTYARNSPLSAVPPVMPRGHKALPGLVVFINGVSTTKHGEGSGIQHIADATQTPTVGIYNATQGLWKDLEHAIDDRFNIGNNPACNTCASLIYNSIKQDKPLRLVGYSQGAIIVSRALMTAQDALEAQGMTEAQVQAAFHKYIAVETMAGAASSYPDGPFYVHYINRNDPVQDFSEFNFGLKYPFTHPGKDAVNIFFSAGSKTKSAHNLRDSYLPHYVLLQTLRQQIAAPSSAKQKK
jgi:hypothetical protein